MEDLNRHLGRLELSEKNCQVTASGYAATCDDCQAYAVIEEVRACAPGCCTKWVCRDRCVFQCGDCRKRIDPLESVWRHDGHTKQPLCVECVTALAGAMTDIGDTPPLSIKHIINRGSLYSNRIELRLQNETIMLTWSAYGLLIWHGFP